MSVDNWAGDGTDPATTRILTAFASGVSRRSFLAKVGAAAAWVVGVDWVSGGLRPWDPFGLTARGSPASAEPETVEGKPWGPAPKDPKKPKAGDGPSPNGKIGTGDGCVRQDQQGMRGCDCRCMYGANACPAGDSAPGGAVWCYCLELVDESGTKQTRYLCFADCFGTKDHIKASTCVNSNRRTCWCEGGKTDGMAHNLWPSDKGKPPGGKKYDCTRVIDVTGTPQAKYNDPPKNTQWFPTLEFPKDTTGTPITGHDVLRTIEVHEGVPDLVLPGTPKRTTTSSPPSSSTTSTTSPTTTPSSTTTSSSTTTTRPQQTSTSSPNTTQPPPG